MGELSDLREYSSMNYCLNEIPHRVRRGLSIVEVHFTCFDVAEEFITVGTNIGVVYWCNRKTNKIERLRPEKYGPAISCVKVVSTVDYMVAAGDSNGVVSIFVIPKEKPLFLPSDHENAKHGIERFTAADLHLSPVTAITWSTNGQKLFTGDEKGVVAYTEMDFQLNIIKSREIINEKFSIVQLSYRSQILLVASEYRCIIYKQPPDKVDPTIHQVGLKERVNLTKLGAIIGSHSSEAGLVIFSARPKQRVWVANTDGNVCRTLLFKEPLLQAYQEIPILRPLGVTDPKSQDSSQNSSINSSIDSLSSIGNSGCYIEFNYFHTYRNKYLVAHNAHSLILLNPETTIIEGGFTTKKILSVAVNKDEIFVLEGYRRIRRISVCNDPHSLNKYCNMNRELPIGDRLLGIVNMIKEEASTNVVQSLIENIKKVENVVVNSQILTGSEVALSPAEEALDLCYPKEEQSSEYRAEHSKMLSNVDSCIDDIVYREKKKSHQKSTTAESCSTETQICDSTIEKIQKTKQCSDYLPKEKVKRKSRDFLKLSHFNEVPTDITPDLRTPDSILRDVEHKELLIAQLLNMNQVSTSSVTSNEIIENAKDADQSVTEANQILLPEDNLNEVFDDNVSEKKIQSDLEEYIKPQGLSEEVLSIPAEEAVPKESSDILPTQQLNCADIALIYSYCEKYWRPFKMPFSTKWMCVSQTDVLCGDLRRSVYQSSCKQFQLNWSKQKCRASKMVVSGSNSILWKLDLGIVYALKDISKAAGDPDPWKLIARNVDSVAVNDWSAWYVSGGSVFAQTGLSKEKPFNESVKLECVREVSKVCCFDDVVWVLTTNGVILNREQVSKEHPLGSNWKMIQYPDTISICDIALCTRNTGWIIDKYNNIYFADDFNEIKTSWWQVIIGRHIYRSDCSLSDQLSRFVHWPKEKRSLSLIASNRDSIWVSMGGENSIYINKTAVMGHFWTPVPVDSSLVFKTKWKFLAAAGENEQTASVWCLSSSNDLFLYYSKQNYIRVVEMVTTNDVVCLSSVPDMLWILTDKGEIYVKRGISKQTPFGWNWEQLHVYQTGNTIPSFKHFSIGREVIWALSAEDKVYAAIADLYSISCETFVLDWVLIEDSPSAEAKFIDVIVGPNKLMVWALDDKYNVYTRQSIFDDFPFGIQWINVPGIKAIHLTVSSSAVWALTVEGYIYRRSGITAKDCVGDCWVQVPGCLSLIAASVCENMWGVSKVTGRLLKYQNHVLSLQEDFIRNRKFSENINDEWEIVNAMDIKD